MNISIVSVFPELYEPFLKTSLIKRALAKKVVDIDLSSFFSFVQPKERIDAPTFGPGAGMLIKPEVVQRAIEAKQATYGPSFNIFFSPKGTTLDQRLLLKLATVLQEKKHIMLLPARYEGMDARVEQKYADMTISIGDYVLMGGDIPAMVVLEGMLRYIPGVVGNEASVEHDSFTGPFVDYPAYTEPVEWQGMHVPDIVRSGNHAAIDAWRKQQAAQESVLHHFDWMRSHITDEKDIQLAASYIPPHYVALAHTDVLIGEEKQPGTTSVTSLDLHDIARSCKTYGIKQYWIVTPLVDQQRIVHKLLDFWRSDKGLAYNPQRQKAVDLVQVADQIDAVVAAIEKKEGKRPIVVGTSARPEHGKIISFYDQGKLWQQRRPVLIVCGTGRGLTPSFLARCDYVLAPIDGFTDFNHLSVRSAAAVILDRWLGINNKNV